LKGSPLAGINRVFEDSIESKVSESGSVLRLRQWSKSNAAVSELIVSERWIFLAIKRSGAGWIADVVVVWLKESKMKKEECEAERRVKGKERKEAKRLWIECLGGGTPAAAAEVFLWYENWQRNRRQAAAKRGRLVWNEEGGRESNTAAAAGNSVRFLAR
jgi:hypothetical protein